MDHKTHFDEIGSEYIEYYQNPSGIMSREKINRLQTALSLVSPSSSDRVLNIGVGAGELNRSIADSVDQVIGLDFSQGMLTTARERASGEYIQGAGQNIPIKADAFDIVFCLGVAGYLESEELSDLIAELARVLHPGGELIISFANAVSPFRRLRQFYYYDFLRMLKRLSGLGTIRKDTYTMYTPEDIESLLDQVGLKITNRRYLTFSTGIFNTTVNLWLYRWFERHFTDNSKIGSLAMTWVLHTEKSRD